YSVLGAGSSCVDVYPLIHDVVSSLQDVMSLIERCTSRWQQIQMHVAVADMTVGNGLTIREGLLQIVLSVSHEICEARERYRDVSTHMHAALGLAFDHAF